MTRWGLAIVTVAAVFTSTFTLVDARPVVPDQEADADVPPALFDLKLDTPITVEGAAPETLDRSLANRVGPVRVVVHLSEPSLAESGSVSRAAQTRQVSRVRGQQQSFERRLDQLAPGATAVASVQRVLNAVFVEADAETLARIAADPAVERVAPVGDYELDLSETVPYIGASAVQATGVDGSGVKVAVLDSGIDYTHANLGGLGTLAEYEAAYGASVDDPLNTTLDGLFPTPKVVGGYDFVGEVWPNGPEMLDPDPIDFQGHGTHVADIIAGVNGVAPGASLYAVKVCSAVAGSCSGMALIQGMEFSADPNGDGDTSDRVDIINMSLGSAYGQPFDDDLAMAVEGATALGILTVASAGNSGDKPYVSGSPAAAPSALSVAQTRVPSRELQLLSVPTLTDPVAAVFQPWSITPAGIISEPIQYGDGAGGNVLGCSSFAAGSLTGKVVLVDRGVCNFTLKIKNIGDAGGLIGIIGLVSADVPFEGGYNTSNGPVSIPGYMISQGDSTALKARVGQTLTLDPAAKLSFAGHTVGSSSRGPSNYYQQIKPEIGAPGASVSAVAGSGDDTAPFGGTSGAAPMAAGAAALLLQKNGSLSPGETKALLMNNAETNIDIFPSLGRAEITRIGGGEVRVNRAIAAPTAAWDDDAPQAALSFGMHEVAQTVTLTKTVRIRNFSTEQHIYTITPTFRFPGRQGVTPSAPAMVLVTPGPGSEATFDISLTIDPALLPANFMNSGPDGANGAALSANEFDGYLVLNNGSGHVINLPWHVLPRKAAETVPDSYAFPVGGATVGLTNKGAGTAQLDSYALLALSPEIPRGPMGAQSPTPDIKSVGINTVPVPTGFCSANPSFLWEFAIDTWADQSHLLPVSHEVYLDIDRNGVDDYVVVNRDLAGLNSTADGRQASYVVNLTTNALSAFFFAEHATNTGNTVLRTCGEQIGMNADDLGVTQVDMAVVAQDFIFGGPGDSVEGLTVTPGGERFRGLPDDDIPGGGTGSIVIEDAGHLDGNSPELGLMVFTNGDRGPGNRGGSTDETDTLILEATPGAPTGVTAVPDDTTVELDWSATANDGGDPITGYRIQSSTDKGTWVTVVQNTATTATTRTVTGLTNGVAIRFQVATINAAGVGPYSSPSSPVTPLTVPGAPTAVKAVAGDTTAKLTWTAPADDGGGPITGYRVQSSTDNGTTWVTVVGNTATNATTRTVTGLTNGVATRFRVAAINAAGAGPYSSASSAVTPVAPVTAPSAPTNLSTTAGATSVTVTWSKPVNDGGSAITGYRVGYTTVSAAACRTDSPGTSTTATSSTVTGLSSGATYWFCVAAVNAKGVGASAVVGPVTLPASTLPASPIVTVDPSRVFDSRALGGPLPAGSVTEIEIANRSGVPSDAAGAVLNVTALDATAPGFLSVFPCGTDVPDASNVNYTTGQTVPNTAISKLGTGGRVCVFTSADTGLIVDVNGYLPATSDVIVQTPRRLYDTRSVGAPADAGSVTEIPIAGVPGAPPNPSGVVLNVTALDATAPGFLAVFPCGTAVPDASNVNYTTGQTVPNAVIARVGSNGSVCVFTSATTGLIVDAAGFVPSGSTLQGINPARMYDSRNGAASAAGSITEVQITGRSGIPEGAATVVLNVTALDASAPGFLTVFPCGTAVPEASNVNYTTGQTVPNAAVAKIGADGRVCVFTSADSGLIVDAAGYAP